MINSVNNANNSLMINVSASKQDENTNKLSSGYKVNRDDAASVSINKNVKNNSANAISNKESYMSDIKSIDEADAMIAKARKNILAQPEESIAAQANMNTSGVINLVQ